MNDGSLKTKQQKVFVLLCPPRTLQRHPSAPGIKSSSPGRLQSLTQSGPCPPLSSPRLTLCHSQAPAMLAGPLWVIKSVPHPFPPQGLCLCCSLCLEYTGPSSFFAHLPGEIGPLAVGCNAFVSSEHFSSSVFPRSKHSLPGTQ